MRRIALAIAICFAPLSANAGSTVDAIYARCKAQNFQEADQIACANEQTNTLNSVAPVMTFITTNKYISQSMTINFCWDASKDYYGIDYVKFASCYDDTITRNCKGNSACLANGTIEGIQAHMKAGTKP